MDQCATDFENTLITTTPAIIKAIPAMAGQSMDCLKMKTETNAVSTIPNPAQVA